MSDIGLKIGIEGEKEFKKALSEINQSFKVLGSEMKLVTSRFDKQDNSIEALTARNKVLNKEIDSQKDKIGTLEKALGNASDSFGENDKRTKAWAVQLNNAKADLNNMERELEQNNKALDKTADEFDDAEKQADQFGDEIEKSAKQADNAGDRFDKLGGVLKSVGTALAAGVVAIGAAVISSGKAIYDMANDVAAAGDEVDKLSQQLGLSAEGYQEWDYVLSQSGVEINNLTTGMKTLTNSLDDAKNGSSSAIEKFDRLGISMSDLEGLSQEDVFALVIESLQAVTDETEKAALANDLFGRSGQEMLPLLNQTAESTQALKDKAVELGMVMSNESVDAAVAYTDAMDTLQRTFTGVKNNILSELLPGFTSVLQGFTGLLSGQEDAGAQIQEGAQQIVSSLTEALPQVTGVIVQLITAVAQIAPTLVSALMEGIVDNLPSLIDTASTVIMTFIESLVEALPQITEGALQLVLSLVDGILENLPLIIEATIQTIITLANGIADALPELIPAIVEAILLIVETLLDHMDELLAAAFQIIEGLAQGLIDALPLLVEKLPEIITAIIDFVVDNLPLFVEMGIELIVQLAIGLVKAIPELIAHLPEIIVALVEGLGEAVGAVLEIGVNIVKGLWEGIKSMASWIGEKVSGFFSGIVDGVKGLLGIQSPSKVFEGIGDNMGQGVGVGFLKAMAGVEDDMKKAIPTDFDISASLSGLQPAFAGMPQGITYNHTGTIRVEGVNDQGILTGVVDIILGQLRQEARL